MELNDNQLWYVRAAIHRGVAAIKENIEDCERLANEAGDKAQPQWAQDSLRGAVAYNKQMLREMEQYIPEELLPR